MKKVHFAGTHRVRHPEETWARLGELRDSFGITRIADVTGLDTLGIPVVAAVRPASRTRPLAYGRGATPCSPGSPPSWNPWSSGTPSTPARPPKCCAHPRANSPCPTTYGPCPSNPAAC